jgi:hypothetical protein
LSSFSAALQIGVKDIPVDKSLATYLNAGNFTVPAKAAYAAFADTQVVLPTNSCRFAGSIVQADFICAVLCQSGTYIGNVNVLHKFSSSGLFT